MRDFPFEPTEDYTSVEASEEVPWVTADVGGCIVRCGEIVKVVRVAVEEPAISGFEDIRTKVFDDVLRPWAYSDASDWAAWADAWAEPETPSGFVDSDSPRMLEG